MNINLSKTSRWSVLFVLLILNSFAASAQLQWVAWNGSIPDNAVVGGNENGGNQYVCRAMMNGAMQPGKVVGGNCNVGFRGMEIVSREFEILLNPGGVNLSWERITENRLPHDAVVGGSENGVSLWVGQVMRSDGTVQGGKVMRNREAMLICNYGYGGKEVTENYNFNVLVARPLEEHRERMAAYQQPAYQQPQSQGVLFQINNKWKPTEFIHVQNFAPASSPIDPGWTSAQWIQEPVPGESFVRLKNPARNNCYLHNQNGNLECGPIDQGWWSAQWSLEQQEGGQYFIIRNRWKPDQAINNQSGPLVCGPTEPGWWSAQWSFVQVVTNGNFGNNNNYNNANSSSNYNKDQNRPVGGNQNEGNRRERWFNNGLPTQVEIINGVVSNRRILSCNREGTVIDLWNNNESGRQKWIFERMDGPEGRYYHIMVQGDVMGGRKFLSVNRDNPGIELHTMDDGSGRQRWVVEPYAGDPNLKIIRNIGGTPGSRRFLSSNPEGTRVDLWTEDDGTGRQRWLIKVLE